METNLENYFNQQFEEKKEIYHNNIKALKKVPELKGNVKILSEKNRKNALRSMETTINSYNNQRQ